MEVNIQIIKFDTTCFTSIIAGFSSESDYLMFAKFNQESKHQQHTLSQAHAATHNVVSESPNDIVLQTPVSIPQCSVKQQFQITKTALIQNTSNSMAMRYFCIHNIITFPIF